MAINRRDFMKLGGGMALTVALASKVQWSGARTVKASAALPLTDETLHVLNRITWGPRPQDIQRIHELGIAGYIDWQLDYANIPDPLIDQFIAEQAPLLNAPYETLSPAADEDYELVYTAAVWGRIYRAIHSERQLYEKVVEFWTDHFNIPISDYLVDKTLDDREVIRRHALGSFRDLLLASAQSPAMLYYLDNAYSNAEHPNENYAREVMELHTLGVQGGYSEDDVKALARILTGWGVRDGAGSNRFFFDPNNHDYEEKVFLGRVFPAGRGVEEGLEALDMLAAHPSTAYYVSRKLVRRFVADMPPDSLVESTAQNWQATGGDIKSVVRHILMSAEFMTSVGQRFKRPLHLFVSIMRAFAPHHEIYDVNWYMWSLEPLGEMPYGWHPPNGYPDVSGAWISTGTLLERWNLGFNYVFATEDWWEGGSLDLDALFPHTDTAGQMVDTIAKRVLGGDLPAADRAALIRVITDGEDMPITPEQRWDRIHTLLGLVFASPYFQWY
jgi:uncharacterized protein (DUF1800 family)